MARKKHRNKFTSSAKKRILTAVAKGATYQIAANYGGVSLSTLMTWKRRGEEEDEGEYVKFFEDFELAKGAAAMKWLGAIDEAAEGGDWRAGMEMLKRRYPDEFGDSSRVDLQSDNTHTIKIVRADD